jgi:hypothetical protein
MSDWRTRRAKGNREEGFGDSSLCYILLFFPLTYLVSYSKSKMEFQKKVCFFHVSFIKQQQKNAIAGVTIQNSGVRKFHKKKYPVSFC